MRQPISWADLPGRRVAIYGLGTEGRANLRAADALGLDPVLVDDHPSTAADAELPGRPVLATTDGGLAAMLAADVVIKTPGISRYGDVVGRLLAAEVLVAGGLGLWLAGADRTKVLVITGTKGKSTTTAITGHLLQRLGYRVLIGGNLGQPPQDPVVAGAYDWSVIEVSSYQATDLQVSPPVVAVTSLHPDHLPWHGGNVEQYYRDKLSATSRTGAELTVANGDSPLLTDRRALLGPRVQWVHADDPDAEWADGLGLIGLHNRRNALIARAALQAMGVPQSFDSAAMADAAAGFAGLSSRLSPVHRIGAVDFIDDSLSTNVLPTLAAVDAFPDRRIALVVGGQSRGIDYQPLGEGLRSRTSPVRLFTIPDNGPEVHRQALSAEPGPLFSGVDCLDLPAAVVAGYQWAGPDGVVLLSPAAPSFGRFADYRDRAAAFTAAAKALG